MVCTVTNLTGDFGNCSQDINVSNFNKDSVFWYIEQENSVYNFKLTLSPYLSATPLKLVYPEIEIYNLDTFNKSRAFPPFFNSEQDTYASLINFDFGVLTCFFKVIFFADLFE